MKSLKRAVTDICKHVNPGADALVLQGKLLPWRVLRVVLSPTVCADALFNAVYPIVPDPSTTWRERYRILGAKNSESFQGQYRSVRAEHIRVKQQRKDDRNLLVRIAGIEDHSLDKDQAEDFGNKAYAAWMRAGRRITNRVAIGSMGVICALEALSNPGITKESIAAGTFIGAVCFLAGRTTSLVRASVKTHKLVRRLSPTQ